jgi:TfoX/Sxy family transcriptional regulator of competence genes
MASDVDQLKSALDSAVSGLSEVTWKRMFGCDAAFRDGTIFALIWKEGRIGLKFPEPSAFSERISTSGSDRWGPGGRLTKQWVLIPDAVASDPTALTEWTTQAHSLVNC